MPESKFLRGAVLSLATLALCASMGRAAIVWNEGTNGNLSTDQTAPTPLTLSAGTNSVIGTVGNTRKGAWIALTIPAGFTLSSDVLDAYSSTDAQGFTGLQAGSSFVGNPETSASVYAGYAHFGTGATNGSLPATNVIGTDLLPIMANPSDAAGAQGFTDPLTAGTYTFLIQQLGATTTYQFDFGVSPVPEPGAIGFIGIGLLALRRRVRIKAR